MAIACCTALSGCSMPAGDDHPLVGQQAPLFAASLLDDSPFDLADYVGRDVIILDFWATWCGPCQQALPTLSDVAAQFKDRGVRFFAVDIEETPDDVRRFLDESSLGLTVVMDRDGSISSQYGVNGIPQTVIIGTDGRVRFVHVGLSGDLRQRLTRELNELVADNVATSGKTNVELASRRDAVR